MGDSDDKPRDAGGPDVQPGDSDDKPRDVGDLDGQPSVSDGGEQSSAARQQQRRQQRQQQRRQRRRREALSWPMLTGALFSVAVSVLLAWLLVRWPDARPVELDPSEVSSVASASLVAQTAAINTLVRHLRNAQAKNVRRLDFLALGPPGTGKTLLTQALASLTSVSARRLVGDAEIRWDREALQALAGELAASAPTNGWLLLALDDIGKHVAEAVYLVETTAAAAQRAGVRLISLVTATTSDLAGEQGADATREAFARHSHLLQFRPMRRSGVAACLLRYAHSRGLPLPEETAESVAKAVKYEGGYAVNGCKPAIYHLRAALKLEAE
ncbi:uncharacterized protein LOC122380763 isoform X1 [Amphibalanus amphitrite]|nr:uncharacterized protein LOC122380763 isoform X1 [Amphibalanus amphitrite]XP_043220135.1 uncharacterized protein LOC122380763 isoform X1 [Amphibalanus amphitrite]XP_043220136.1 uncharacterized protein LOC122380763 isoform X1 [Amphibalanus amphitrite]XP_043220137.1 uncharacterized protein LOC122380763 isoform X1 [Amphibalanus amphitrite]